MELDSYPMPDPNMGMDALAGFGKEAQDLLPIGRELAQELCSNNWHVYYMENGKPVMAIDIEDVIGQPEGTVFAMFAQDWQIHPRFREYLLERLEKKEKREAAFDAYPEDCYAIYQLCRDLGESYRDYAFRDYQSLRETGLAAQRPNYDLIYTSPMTEPVGLDDLFEKFNIDRPGDFGGHSMSVSDIVAIKRDGQVSYHYCDSVGFQELPDFRQPENYLKNAELSTEDDCNMIGGIINNGPKEEPTKKPSVL